LPSTIRLPGPRLMGFRPRAGLEGIAMELFTQLIRRSACLRLPLLRPHCHLRLPSAGSRGPSRSCIFFRQVVVVVPVVGKENPEPAHRRLPELGGSLRPQSPAADRMGRERRAQGTPLSCPGNAAWPGTTPTASTSSSRAWSRGRAFASASPNTATKDPNYRILARQRSRFTHYYF